MPNVAIGFGLVLCAIGLFGYFGSTSENPSVTALIPFFFGDVLILCGVLAYKSAWRKHAMHAAAAVALVGLIAAATRFPKLGELISDDPTVHRAPRLILAMIVVCFVFVLACIWSFISARRRRKAEAATAE